MRLNDALKTLLETFPFMKVKACTEYNDIYVFEEDRDGYDGLWSVDKLTGEVKSFLPTDISQEDYNSGKKVGNFKKED